MDVIATTKSLKDKKNYFTWHNLSLSFENLKNIMKQKENFFLNYFYCLFGEQHESIINNVNFFHFATESVILLLLKTDINLENPLTSESYTSTSTSSKLKNFNFEYEDFYENFKLLTGTFYIYDSASKISETNITKLFYNNFKYLKNIHNFLNENFKNIKDLFTHICHLSVSFTLCELSLLTIEKEKVEKEFYKLAFEACNKDTFHNYLKLVENHLNQDVSKSHNNLIILKIAYFYFKTNFDDYVTDLNLFSEHSNTFFEKIRKFSGYEKIQKKLKNVIKMSQTISMLKKFYLLTSTNFDKKSHLIKSKMHSFKNWINESISKSPFYEKLNISKIFLYDRVLSPSKNFLVIYTESCVTFIITNIFNAKSMMRALSSYLEKTSQIFLSNLEKKINEEDLCIKFTSDENVNFIKMDLNNSVLMINSTNFSQFVRKVSEYILKISSELIANSKNYLLKRYKLFLGEDERNLVK
jgi:hypothetical protein